MVLAPGDENGPGGRLAVFLHVAVADVALGRVGTALSHSAVRSVGSTSAVQAVGVGRGLPVAEVRAVAAASDAPGKDQVVPRFQSCFVKK